MNKAIFLLLVLALGTVSTYAKRKSPAEVAPIVFQGIKYSAPHSIPPNEGIQNGGYIEAISMDTGKILWDLKIYEVKYDPGLEGDVQDVYITSLKIAGGNLEVLNEKEDTFVVDLTQRKVIQGANRVYRFKASE